MTMLVTSNPILGKMQKHLGEYGLLSSQMKKTLFSLPIIKIGFSEFMK